jgi:hypothetical protein
MKRNTVVMMSSVLALAVIATMSVAIMAPAYADTPTMEPNNNKNIFINDLDKQVSQSISQDQTATNTATATGGNGGGAGTLGGTASANGGDATAIAASSQTQTASQGFCEATNQNNGDNVGQEAENEAEAGVNGTAVLDCS